MDRRDFIAAVAAGALGFTVAFSGLSASSKTFRYAFQGDLNALDPYTLNEGFTLGALGNVYEGLTKLDKDLKIIPGLAERWEIIDPLKWRIHLRKGVTFHNGEDFTADDVIFSLERVRTPGSQLRTAVPGDMRALKIDDYTVDFVLTSPNPILNAEWSSWYILSKKWAEVNGATQAEMATATSLSPVALKANGTGPFLVESHEPGVKTVFKPNPKWWGKKEHNFDEVVFQTIKSDATRVAALLSGEIDMMDPVPVQDIDRVNQSGKASVLQGAEIRTIFLNMDQKRDELLYSSVKGKNPFKDVRVRKAFYQAIDIETIKTKVMRGTSTPTALLISPLLFSRAGEFKRHPYDVAEAKRLLTEAGYPNGFEITLDCPNDRYVNDEAICQAVAQMLSRIDVNVTLNSMPKSKFFQKAGPSQKYDSSFSLLGWTPASYDSWNVLANVVGCRDESGRGGLFNFGGYCNPKVDALAKEILVATDTNKRDDMIVEAFRILHQDVSHIPLHQQALAWGVAKGTTIVQRANNAILFYQASKD